MTWKIPGLVVLVLGIILSLAGCGEFHVSGWALHEVDGCIVGMSGVTIIAENDGAVVATATTDEQGFWFMEGLAKRVIVYAKKDGFCFEFGYEVRGSAGGLDFLGIPGYEVWGWVKTENGLPIPEAMITFTAQEVTGKFRYRPQIQGQARIVKSGIPAVVTDSNGYWHGRGLSGTVVAEALIYPMSFSPDQIELTGPAGNVTFIGSYVECENVQHIFAACAKLYMLREGELPWVKKLDRGWDWDWPRMDEKLAGMSHFSGFNNHTAALKSDGTVWSWGAGWSGSFGAGSFRDSKIPVMAYQLTGVRQVAAGGRFSLALKEDGTLWFWGSLWGSPAYYTPIQVNAPSDFVQIRGGEHFAVALDSSGSVWAWGYNSDGQLGIAPSSQPRETPASISGLGPFGSITAGSEHVLALAEDGTVWAWGNNEYGQLGNGQTGLTGTPSKVPNLMNVKEVLANDRQSFALKADGTVWFWGFRDWSAVTTPIRISGINDVIEIAATWGYIFMLRSDGTVWWAQPGFTQPKKIEYLDPNGFFYDYF